MDLFDTPAGTVPDDAPLAERLRPRTLDQIVGQSHLLGEDKLLRRLIESDQLSSLILWGPPGTGKTTLSHVISNATQSRFVFFSAVLGSIKEVRAIVAEARDQRRYHNRRTLLFVDEIHRFNKAQQDAFLPPVEKGDIILIGATTENPSFEVNAALLSRSKVFVLEPLVREELVILLKRALTAAEGLGPLNLEATDEALAFIADLAQGDARAALNQLEVAAHSGHPLTLESLEKILQRKALLYDKGGEEHYNVISAFIKSVRGSDPDAALYYLARMIEAGEDPMFIARRLVILASEDVGNADPRGLQVAVAGQQALHFIGMPEGRITLAQVTTYLATAPKSNAAYIGIKMAQAEVQQSGPLPVPMHIRNAPTGLMKDLGYGKGYQYAHDQKNTLVEHGHLPEKLQEKRFYTPTDRGYEKAIQERLAYWNSLRQPPNDHSVTKKEKNGPGKDSEDS